MDAALLTHRRERWTYELLDQNEASLGMLQGVKGCTLDFSIFATITSGGTLNITEVDDVNWHSCRVAVAYNLLDSNDQVTQTWPIGIFIPAAPKRNVEAGGAITRAVELYDKTLILMQDQVEDAYTVEAGEVVTEAVTTVIQGTGQAGIAITASAEVTAGPRTWEAGTPKLTIVNDLLRSINYFSVWCDGVGIFRSEPYRPPSQRLPVHTFADDAQGLYLPAFGMDLDNFDVPNKLVQIVSNPDQPVLKSTATNEDPASPFSYQSRGRWITKVVKDAEATSQDVLDGLTERELNDLTTGTENLETKHAWLPIYLNDVVGFRNAASGTDQLYAVVKQRLDCKPGGLVTATIRRAV